MILGLLVYLVPLVFIVAFVITVIKRATMHRSDDDGVIAVDRSYDTLRSLTFVTGVVTLVMVILVIALMVMINVVDPAEKEFITDPEPVLAETVLYTCFVVSLLLFMLFVTARGVCLVLTPRGYEGNTDTMGSIIMRTKKIFSVCMKCTGILTLLALAATIVYEIL